MEARLGRSALLYVIGGLRGVDQFGGSDVDDEGTPDVDTLPVSHLLPLSPLLLLLSRQFPGFVVTAVCLYLRRTLSTGTLAHFQKQRHLT